MYVNVSQRFIEAVDYLISCKHLKNHADLAARLQISKGYMSQIMQGKREPSEPIVNGFANLFPKINRAWLLTGEGRMVMDQMDDLKIGEQTLIPTGHSSEDFSKVLDSLNLVVMQNNKLLDIVDRLTQK